jgi:transcriptional regulator with XRE-family HTH domain
MTDDAPPTQLIQVRSNRRPDWALVEYEGLPHLLHLRALRRALLNSAIAGTHESRESLAEGTGFSRSTVSRFVAGRNTSTRTTRAILAELGLKWDDVLYALPDELLRELRSHARTVRNGVTVLDVDPYELPGVRDMLARTQQALALAAAPSRKALPVHG